MARPKREFTDEETQKIEEYALNNCHFETIALALEIPVNTLKRRFGRFIKQKRAEGRIRLRGYQTDLAKNNPAMAIFLGKNELGQTDKQLIEQRTTIIDVKPEEKEAYEAAAKEFKIRMA